MAEVNAVKLCGCGCGKPTIIWGHACRSMGRLKGQGRPFLKGHNPRWQEQAYKGPLNYVRATMFFPPDVNPAEVDWA
jgi:hypothetical protein